jgi:hypothetical protein
MTSIYVPLQLYELYDIPIKAIFPSHSTSISPHWQRCMLRRAKEWNFPRRQRMGQAPWLQRGPGGIGDFLGPVTEDPHWYVGLYG